MKKLSPLIKLYHFADTRSQLLGGIARIIFAKGGYKILCRKITSICDREAENKVLFVDVSGLVRKDCGTGIQRVARNLVRELTKLLNGKVDVIPVWAGISTSGYYKARMILHGQFPIFVKTEIPLACRTGDIFLGADHNPAISIAQGYYLKELKKKA